MSDISKLAPQGELFSADAVTGMLIDGAWVPAATDDAFDVYDPCTGGVVARVAEGGAQDVDRAVAAARRAFEEERWGRLSGEERGIVLWRVADLLNENAEDLALLESVNLGLPAREARNMVSEAAKHFRYCAGWADKIHGRAVDIGPAGRRLQGHTRKEPIGVAGLIVPWNVPLIAAAKKLAPALAAGCTCVLKPAEETPLTALRLGEILQHAGVPDGVVNVVTGFGVPAGAALAGHHDVDKIAFTGSTEVGRLIVEAAAGNLKKLTLELGGKSPVIVLPDADRETVVQGVALGAFWNTGQVCAAGTRLFAHRDVFDEVVEGVAAYGRSLKVGPVDDPSADMGPLISQQQLDRVAGYVQGGVADGARVLSGGSRVGRSGYFFEPTVMVDVDQSMPMMREEIFGPVLGAMAFTDVDEAIAAANHSSYGLAASVWTRDVAAANSIARRLRAGRVGINVHRAGGVQMPVGGYRESGWGRESGPEGIEEYLETKSVVTLLEE